MTDLYKNGPHISRSGGYTKFLMAITFSFDNILVNDHFPSIDMTFVFMRDCTCTTYIAFDALCKGCQGAETTEHVFEDKSSSLELECQ